MYPSSFIILTIFIIWSAKLSYTIADIWINILTFFGHLKVELLKRHYCLLGKHRLWSQEYIDLNSVH